MAYVPPLNGGRINASIGGNSTSAGGGYSYISTGNMILAGGNNVTLSQNANTITISAANQSNQNVSLYATGNTTQNSSTLLNASNLSFNGLGNISVGFSNGSIQLSQTGGGGGGVALYDGANSISSGTAQFSNSNGVSFGFNGQTITGSVAAQSNQTVSFSAGSQSTLTATGTFDARSYFLNGVGAAKVGFSQSSVFVSVPTQSVESQSIGMHTATAGGGTGGTSGSASGGQIQYNFYAGSNITLSQSVNGASGSLSIYGTSGGGGGVALYDGANSITSGTARFSNSNGVSFGINGQTITGSVAAQTNQSLGMYVLNNTVTNGQSSSSTLDARSVSFTNYGAISGGFSGGSMQLSVPATSNLVGTNGISMSTNGSTISVQPSLATAYVNMLPVSTATSSWGALGVSNGSAWFYPVSIANPVVFDAIRIASSLSWVTSSAAGSQTISQSFGLYSLTGSTLTSISTNSIGYSASNSSTSASFSFATSTGTGGYGYGQVTTQGTAAIQSSFGTGGMRMIDLQFGNTMSLSAGMYWLGLARSENTAGGAVGIGQSIMGNVFVTASYGIIGSASSVMASNSSLRMPYNAFGPYGASTNALPGSISISSINNSISVLPLMTFLST